MKWQAFLLPLLAAGQPLELRVDFSAAALPFEHFWRATGWCPPQPVSAMHAYALSESSVQTHALIASVPNRGIELVRVHDLLYLLGVPNGTHPGAIRRLGPAVFEYDRLDSVLDLLHRRGLSVGFEIMGNPLIGAGETGLFTDWHDGAQLDSWQAMVEFVARRYIGRYGLEYVRSWRWEGWNEPDHVCNTADQMRAGINCTLIGWLGYMQACSRGLRRVHSELKFGGPGSGGSTLETPFLAAMLDRARVRPDDLRVDFVQWHQKGIFQRKGRLSNTAADLRVMAAVQQAAGNQSGVILVGNEEVDVQGDWAQSLPWRGDVRDPAAMARVLLMHQQELRENATLYQHTRYTYHANDNAFLNYGDRWFDQRTLTVRFLMNHTGTVEVLRKPTINLMAALSLLGDSKYPVSGPELLPASDRSSSIGAIATSLRPTSTAEPQEHAILLYNSNGTADASECSPHHRLCNATVRVDISSLPATAVVARIYSMSAGEGDPRAAWEQMGGAANPYPTPEQFAVLRQRMELPARTVPVPADRVLTLSLPQPAVALVHICRLDRNKLPSSPEKPTGLGLHLTTTRGSVLVTWRDIPQRCLKTWEVLWSRTRQSNWERVNTGPDTIFTSFLHAQDVSVAALGCYKVRAVDYSLQGGEYSDATCIGQ